MSQPILDLAAFRRLADGDSGRTARLVNAFKASMRASLDQLAAAVAAGDTDAMRAVGHKIKSGPAWVGALDLCEIGQRIEDAAGGRSPAGRDELPQLVGRAEASFRAVVVEMDRALVSLEDVGIRRDVP